MANQISNASTNFINGSFTPTIYAPRLVAKFYAESVCNEIMNMYWSEEIKDKGDTIIIRQRPTVTTTPYAKNMPTNWTAVEDSSITLAINYAFQAAVALDIVDQHQFDINVQPELLDEISNQLRLDIESVVLGSLYASAGTTIAYNKYTSWDTFGTYGNTSSALMMISDAHAVLDLAHAPQKDRWLLLHPRMMQKLKSAMGLYALNAGTVQGAQQRGFVDEIEGFKVFVSPFVPGSGSAASPYMALAGHIEATTLATQFTQFEVLPWLESRSGIGIRATNCFGFQVLKPDCLVCLQGYNGTN